TPCASGSHRLRVWRRSTPRTSWRMRPSYLKSVLRRGRYGARLLRGLAQPLLQNKDFPDLIDVKLAGITHTREMLAQPARIDKCDELGTCPEQEILVQIE